MNRTAPKESARPPAKEVEQGDDCTKATQRQALSYGLVYALLRLLQRPFDKVVWSLEQKCSRIETKHELAKWNGGGQ